MVYLVLGLVALFVIARVVLNRLFPDDTAFQRAFGGGEVEVSCMGDRFES